MTVAPPRHVAPFPQGWREFSLYGVNRNDRVASCHHFMAADADDAVMRAQALIPRFHKVEVWDGATCVFAAFGAAAGEAGPSSPIDRWLKRLRPRRRPPIPIG